MKYLYALTAIPMSSPGEGMLGEPLRVVRCDGIFAVLGDVPRLPRPTPELLQKQDSVVRRLATCTDALLPARFGQAASSEETLLDSIRSDARDLRARLELVRGCEQMTLRFFATRLDGDGATNARAGDATHGTDPVSGDDDRGPSRESPGLAYLRARSTLYRSPTAESSLPGAAALLVRLRGVTRGEKFRKHDRAPLVASVYHLVPRTSIATYMARISEARPLAPSFRISMSGPWPPYAFAQEPSPRDELSL
ncbi:MAG TPA: GvpL/GvpF family gas vesicle protein [Planctomycetota bacterium]|nr:GvpL/GvpF family gas vesicle protein [Planctomycetota bacterium]